MTYTWKITKDYIDGGEATGTTGPENATDLTENEAKFRMLDDDNTIYYHGKIYGDYEGFEPLDDFGMPHAGCCIIEYKNADGDWEVL